VRVRRRVLRSAGNVHVDAIVRLVETVIRDDIIIDHAGVHDLYESPLGVIGIIYRLGGEGHA
jgi:hypothetical protein